MWRIEGIKTQKQVNCANDSLTYQFPEVDVNRNLIGYLS